MENYYVVPNCEVKNLSDIYLDYFGYIQNGFFIDVGACDGVLSSNTFGLAKAGWGGICYEPLDSFYNSCVQNYKNHKNVKIINTCIGNKTGTVDFIVAGTLSTYSDWHSKTEYWKGDYAYSHKVFSHITTLDKSLEKNKVEPNFEVLSLDVEGSESEVLECFDIRYWRPKMAIVEAQELHPAKELRKQAPFINKYFENEGYKKIYCDEINNIYVL